MGGKSTAVSFAGHETFPFRYTWLQKAVHLIANAPDGFGREDAMVDLGVGKNMVRSIRHWALACGVLEEDPTIPNNRGRILRVTELGDRLFGEGKWDTFLEDPLTLWLLHWQLATNPIGATSWYYVFNHFHKPEFTKRELAVSLKAWAWERGAKIPADSTFKRDVDCLLRTYVPGTSGKGVSIEDSLDCPLTTLGLVEHRTATGDYALVYGWHETLPDVLVAYALLERTIGEELLGATLALADVAFAPFSPGRVFCLNEDSLLARCERLESITDGALVFDETAGLRQIIVKRRHDPLELLGAYYAQATGQIAA